MNILQEIFKDNYEIIQYTLHPRAVEMENIEKMVHCGVKYCQERSTSMSFYILSSFGKLSYYMKKAPPERCLSTISHIRPLF